MEMLKGIFKTCFRAEIYFLKDNQIMVKNLNNEHKS